MAAGITIASAQTEADVAAVAELFAEYAATLSINLDYQGFDEELRGLPGQYAAPLGLLLLARCNDGTVLACVACRPLAATGACEMKCLFVAPQGRGMGLGRKLVRHLIADAASLGYTEMRLDTLPTMQAAQTLYLAEGFEVMAPYYATLVPGTIFMRRPLA